MLQGLLCGVSGVPWQCTSPLKDVIHGRGTSSSPTRKGLIPWREMESFPDAKGYRSPEEHRPPTKTWNSGDPRSRDASPATDEAPNASQRAAPTSCSRRAPHPDLITRVETEQSVTEEFR
eukprot:gene685-biopygen13311